MPELLRLLTWGVLMLLLGLGMVRAAPFGQLIGYLLGLPVLCLAGGVADVLAACMRRRTGWRLRVTGGILGVGALAAFVIGPMLVAKPPPTHKGPDFGPVIVALFFVMIALVPWGLLNGAINLAVSARERPAAIPLGLAQAATGAVAALPFLHGILAPTDGLNSILDVVTAVQIAVLVAGGAAVVLLSPVSAGRSRRSQGVASDQGARVEDR